MKHTKLNRDQVSRSLSSGPQIKTVVSLSGAQRVLLIVLPIVILWGLVYWASE